jgi:hypothetical protein
MVQKSATTSPTIPSQRTIDVDSHKPSAARREIGPDFFLEPGANAYADVTSLSVMSLRRYV